jgi:heptosyltransferase-2
MADRKFKSDCRYFKGDKPCIHNRLCSGCTHYSRIKKKILIIKFDSIGDVLRTTPLLPALKERYPGSYILWLTSLQSYQILKGNDLVDEILAYNLDFPAHPGRGFRFGNLPR